MASSALLNKLSTVEERSGALNRIIRRMGMFSGNKALVSRILDETLHHDPDNFLFISSGSGMIIRGMHYPDSALGDAEFPVIFKTSEENVLIAAWPQSIVKKCLELVTAKSDESNLKTNWAEALEVFSMSAELKIQSGEINDYL